MSPVWHRVLRMCSMPYDDAVDCDGDADADYDAAGADAGGGDDAHGSRRAIQ